MGVLVLVIGSGAVVLNHGYFDPERMFQRLGTFLVATTGRGEDATDS